MGKHQPNSQWLSYHLSSQLSLIWEAKKVTGGEDYDWASLEGEPFEKMVGLTHLEVNILLK